MGELTGLYLFYSPGAQTQGLTHTKQAPWHQPPVQSSPALPIHLSFFAFGASSLPESLPNVSIGLTALLRLGTVPGVLHD